MTDLISFMNGIPDLISFMNDLLWDRSSLFTGRCGNLLHVSFGFHTVSPFWSYVFCA